MHPIPPPPLETPPRGAAAPGGTAGDPGIALHTSARVLVALASQLRWAAPKDPAAAQQALVAAVARFEQEATARGCEPRSVVAASYLLCAWVDEVVAQTPWGAAGPGLLQRFHGDRQGGDKVFRLLSKLAEQPRHNAALLQLFHACLCLGLQGHWRQRADGAQQLAVLRERLHALLRDSADGADGDAAGPPGRPRRLMLSPAWQGAAPLPTALPRRWLWGAVLALGLLAFGTYAGLRLQLARQADLVLVSMQGLEQRSGPAGTAPGEARPRLAPLLAADLQARRLQVRDQPHRSTVTVTADSLFEPASTRLAPAARPLLARVATAIRASAAAGDAASAAAAPGPQRLLVAAYSDGADAGSVRLPSAWHQTLEWASAVAQVLQGELPAVAVAIESRGDSVAPAPSPSPPEPRRRIEIVLSP